MSSNLEPQSPDLGRLRRAVRDAFAPATPAPLAAQRILDRLPAASSPCHLVTPSPCHPFASRRWHLAAAILLLVGLTGGFALGRYHPAPAGATIPVRITALSGTVLVKHAGQTDWHELTRTSRVRLGDLLHATGASGATLALWDDSTLTLNPNTTLSADAFNGKVEFSLDSGSIKASLESRHPPFFIRTPQGTLEALGTEFTVSVE